MNDLKRKIFTAVENDLDDIEKAISDNLNPYLDLVSDVAGHIQGVRLLARHFARSPGCERT